MREAGNSKMQNNDKQKGSFFSGFLLYFIVFTFGLLVTGFLVSKDAVPPDPNDPAQNSDQSFEAAEKELARHYISFSQREQNGEITPERVEKEMAIYANKYATILQAQGISPGEQFRYGQVLRTGRQWKPALEAYTKAQIHFKNNEDLWVNSTLRMAHCNAQLGNGQEAITLIRLSFDAQPGNKVGILLATLYEVAPPLRGKGMDKELANLLLDSIEQHRMAMVEPKSEPGIKFKAAKSTHITKALNMAAELFGPNMSIYEREALKNSGNDGTSLKI